MMALALGPSTHLLDSESPSRFIEGQTTSKLDREFSRIKELQARLLFD